MLYILKITFQKCLKRQLSCTVSFIYCLGGWNHEKLPRFSRMVRSKATRSVFIQSVISYLTRHRLDGISIDWEYPAHRGTSVPEDKQRFTFLLKEMRHAFDSQKLPFSLSASVSAGRKIISTAYEIPEIANYVDWVNIMAYALYGGWSKKTGHHTAMEGGLPNVPDCLSAWQELGMPNHKINLGIATYGRSLKLCNTEKYGLSAPACGAGKPGKHVRLSGALSYYEICTQHWTHTTSYKESLAKKPYSSRGDQWVGYETPESIAYEVETIFSKNCLHGIAVWEIGYDDFNGEFCKQGKFPLLTAAVKALNNNNNCKMVDELRIIGLV